MSNINKQARQVSRFDLISGYMQKLPDGEYVYHSDYQALLDELEAAEKRVAELEAREVVLPKRYSMLHRDNFDEPYHTEFVYKQHQALEVLHDAGISIKGE